MLGYEGHARGREAVPLRVVFTIVLKYFFSRFLPDWLLHNFDLLFCGQLWKHCVYNMKIGLASPIKSQLSQIRYVKKVEREGW